MIENNFIEEQRYLKAKKRVEDIKGFYVHLALYCFCIPILIAVNLIFSPQFHWFWFSTIGWALAIFFHWLGVFGFKKLGFNKDWEKRKIEELMEQDKKDNNG